MAKKSEANRLRGMAAQKSMGDPLLLHEAKKLEEEANAILVAEQPIANRMCGEMVPTLTAGDAAANTRTIALRNTLSRPTQITSDASANRTGLLVGRTTATDISALAIDAAQTIEASNSLEKMLAHQLAALHNTAMRFQTKAVELLEVIGSHTGEGPKFLPQVVQESVRMANASARQMTVFQEGLLALARVRSGGTQTVVVKRVTVEAGGQAAIGNLGLGASTPRSEG